MPRDAPSTSITDLPPWLSPRLLDLLARSIEQAAKRGVAHDRVLREAVERAQACCPSLPAPHVGEAVALALWIAQAPGPDG